MYLATNVHITFPETRGRNELKFISCNSFKTDSSWKNLTDTAEFIISKELYFSKINDVYNKIKEGDPFYIEAGYNGDMQREFTGYISEILDDLPVMFKGEDSMYFLKRHPVNTSFKQVKLATLLKAIVPPQFKINAADMQLGDFVFNKYTVSQVLQELKNNYGIYSYFVDDTLVSGQVFVDNPRTQVVKFNFGARNFVDNDLKYRTKSGYPMKVTMRSHLSNGKVLKETVGDPDGQEQKLVCSNITDRAQIRTIAQNELNRLQYNGYRGTLTSFGIPFIRHGYTAQIINDENPARSGFYYIDSVTTTFNDHGAFRRISTIGKLAANQ